MNSYWKSELLKAEEKPVAHCFFGYLYGEEYELRISDSGFEYSWNTVHKMFDPSKDKRTV